MNQTPEERRDDAIARIIEAGGIVTGTVPLATKEEPHVVAAYRIDAGAPDNATAARLFLLRRETEDKGDYIFWTEAPVENVEE